MARRLTLERFAAANINYEWAGAFRLRVECSDPTDSGADPYVFIYRRDPINPYTQEANDTFFAIASPVDLANLPVGAPNDQLPYPFFRLSYVELDFGSTAQALDVWVEIVAQVSTLLAALTRLENLEVREVVNVGDPNPQTGNSESSSDSQSFST